MALVHFIQILLFGTLPLIANCTDTPQLLILVTDFGPTKGPAAIYKYNFNQQKMTLLSPPHVMAPFAIDYDNRDEYIYWTDINSKQVRRAGIDGGNNEAVVNLNSTSVPIGLTLDSNTRQVFYTDQGNNVIARIEMHTFQSTVIVNTRLDAPAGIVADTKNRRLYWVDFGGNQTLESCDYNGSGRRTVVSRDLWAPYGITIDEQAGRLFWSEISGFIESVLVSGSGRKVVNESPGKQFTDIYFFNGFLYYTSVNDTGISVFDENGNSTFIIPTSSLNRPRGIHVFSSNVDSPVTCPKGQYGVNCDTCGKCAGLPCEKTTGICITGCQPGYQDIKCLKADSTTEATSSDGKMTESGLSSGVIAGIAVGVAVLVIVVAVIVVFVVRKRKPSRLTEENGGMSRESGNVNPGVSNNEYDGTHCMHDIISNETTLKNLKNANP